MVPRLDKLITDILELERAAIESMASMTTNKATHTSETQEEISRRVLEVKRHADKELQNHKKKAEADTQFKLKEIESECQNKAAELKSIFTKNADKWRCKWVAHILEI